MRISIIIPALNEAESVEEKLNLLQVFRDRHEVIFVDGGSEDQTVALATPLVDHVICSEKGRARQMNSGAEVASGDVLLFLHLDTLLPDSFEASICSALESSAVWGRFDVEVQGRHWILPVVSKMMNVRSRLTGIATGDQAIFVRSDSFQQIGGYPNQTLMEDLEISSSLKKIMAPYCIREKVITSGRRWDSKGAFRTILLMWSLRGLYWLGVSPQRLARWYGYDTD